MGSEISLDSILSAMSFHARKWSPDLVRRQSRDLLRFLTIRFYRDNNGNLNTASLTLSQSALADKIGITREWCNKLLAQLKAEGWITYASSRRPDGLRTTCTYSIGNMMRRLLIMLTKSRAKKSQQKQAVNSRSQSFPFSLKKHFFPIQQEENKPPKPETLAKVPLLKRWLARGKEAIGLS